MSLILYLVAIDDFLLFHGLIYVCKLFLAFSITLQAWIQPGFSHCHLAPWFCCQGYRKFCYNLAIRVWTFYSISWSLLLWKKSLLVLGTKQGGCCSSFEFCIPEQLSFLCGIWVDIWIAKGKRKKKKKKEKEKNFNHGIIISASIY